MLPTGKAMNMEKIYKTMRNTGAGCIVIGIIIAVTGLTVGVISIINGALLLKRKSDIVF
jgi:hypothetical protein